jgi:hypothetical protein
MKKGQTLVVLLVFVAIAIMVTTAAVIVTVVNSQGGVIVDQGNQALNVAESGAENALLQLLRNPGYTGETLSVGNGQAVVNVPPGSSYPKTLTSFGKIGDFTRTIQVVFTYDSNYMLTVSSWREAM